MKHTVLVLGAGKIGSLITCLLSNSGEYTLHLADSDAGNLTRVIESYHIAGVVTHQLDVAKQCQLLDCVEKINPNAIVSALPYYCNCVVADVAAQCGIHYFDLTEDVSVTEHVKKISAGQTSAFVPQCGLAPGFISIVANALMQKFDQVDSVFMRVGALPVNPNNALKYSLTWSTDGLINEYGNPCYGIERGELSSFLPLEGFETISVDGLLYEAFNTSGGLGTLADTYNGRVNTMNYKTLRYPGHCKKIKFLMNDLKLNESRDLLKQILENAIPQTKQDVVLIYVSVKGYIGHDLFEENYVKKIYPKDIAGCLWSAIQVTTASGICSVVDTVLNHQAEYCGFVTQEQFNLSDILNNKFGQHYA